MCPWSFCQWHPVLLTLGALCPNNLTWRLAASLSWLTVKVPHQFCFPLLGQNFVLGSLSCFDFLAFLFMYSFLIWFLPSFYAVPIVLGESFLFRLPQFLPALLDLARNFKPPSPRFTPTTCRSHPQVFHTALVCLLTTVSTFHGAHLFGMCRKNFFHHTTFHEKHIL